MSDEVTGFHITPPIRPKITASQIEKTAGFKTDLNVTMLTVKTTWLGININIIPTSSLMNIAKIVLVTEIPSPTSRTQRSRL